MAAKLPSVEEQEAYFDEQDRKRAAAASKEQARQTDEMRKWETQLAIEQEKTRRELEKIQAQAESKARAEQAKEDAAARKYAIDQEKRERADREARAKAEATAKPLSIPYSPSAGRVRQATGQVLPTTTSGYLNAMLGVGLGAAAGCVVPGLMPADEKWAGALVIGLLGLGLLLTSPVASIAQEAGIGMVGAATAFFYLNLTGQICSPTTASPVVMKDIAADNFVQIPQTPDEPDWTNPWNELGYAA